MYYLGIHKICSIMMLMMYLCYPAVALSVSATTWSRQHSILVTNGIPPVKAIRTNPSITPTFLRFRGGNEEDAVSIEEEESSAIDDSAALSQEEETQADTITEESQETTIEAETTLENTEADQADTITEETTIEAEETPDDIEADVSESSGSTDDQILESKTVLISSILAGIKCVGSSYSSALIARPIITKALTACVTFGLSDWAAQRIESKPTADETKKAASSSKAVSKSESTQPLLNWKRTMYTAGVGLFYFGPAAHYWYEYIFKIFPGTSLVSTLLKTLLGQVIFGPIFTCIFFASALLQDKTFTVQKWVSQIKTDLPGVWVSGVGFWPLVDMVSYSLVPVRFIPLFINMASFVWTIYLSMVANNSAKEQ